MIDQAQAKQKDYVSQLLAELRKARGLDDTGGSSEPIDLPNPISRRLQ